MTTHAHKKYESTEMQKQQEAKPTMEDIATVTGQGGRPAPPPGGGMIPIQISSTVNTTLTDFEIWRNKQMH